MTPRERVRNALPAVGLAWIAHLGLALAPAWQAQRGLWTLVGARPTGARALATPGGGVALDTATRWLEGSAGTFVWAFAPAWLGALVLSPWLTMTCLAALERPLPLGRAARAGMRRYLPAVGVVLAVAVVGVLALAVASLLPLGAHLGLRSQPNVRTHDLAVLCASLPGLVVLAVLGAWKDLARGALTSPGTRVVTALRQGLRAALRPRRVLSYAGYWLLGLLLAAAALRLSAVGLEGILGMTLVVIGGQTLALARFVVRARWLATTLLPNPSPKGPS